MTIVCYDGKKMVADSLGVLGEELKLPGAIQKIYTPGPDDYWEINGTKVIAFGIAGMLSATPYIKTLLQEGVTYKTVINPAYNIIIDALCVLESGEAYMLSADPSRNKGPGAHDLIMTPLPLPAAIGSGSVYAFSVMSPKDKNQAEKGVAAAKRLCVYCGGDNVEWEFPGAPETPSKRPVLTEAQLTDLKDEVFVNHLSVGEIKGLVTGLVNKFMGDQKVSTVAEVKE